MAALCDKDGSIFASSPCSPFLPTFAAAAATAAEQLITEAEREAVGRIKSELLGKLNAEPGAAGWMEEFRRMGA